jgi:hypothetical protein
MSASSVSPPLSSQETDASNSTQAVSTEIPTMAHALNVLLESSSKTISASAPSTAPSHNSPVRTAARDFYSKMEGVSTTHPGARRPGMMEAARPAKPDTK